MDKTYKRIGFAIVSGIATLLLVVSPVALVRGTAYFTPFHWQEQAFVVISVIISFVSGLLGFGPTIGIKEIKQQRAVLWIFIFFIYFYIACGALCERLGAMTFNSEILRTLGVVLLVIGGGLRIWAIAVLGRMHSAFVTLMPDHKLMTTGPYSVIRHPSYLGMLIAFAGIPLMFGAWFPLFALPGAYIVIKWRINDEEDFLSEHFGEEYEAYRAKTWRLIPRIY